ncbi:minor tail protein [Corynebacterium phage EmiRose]|uniref:Minor tail protein n=1 Tax=Corynebacterium phage EmiRose TaxID=2565372 RepID=A0A649VPN6_9CAUD|nr:minor tail protein [Corynebacterium phage EmiRose]QGJ94154.1 minor tail protein [Corynebacterium phage EmiRose]
MELIPSIIAGLSPVLVVLTTWATKHSMEKREAKARDYFQLLDSQRETFSTVLDPLKQSLADTRAELEDTRATLDNTRQALARSDIEVASLRTALERSESEVAKLKESIAALSEEQRR